MVGNFSYQESRHNQSNSSIGSSMWLIVGLGNPGAQYETTRHNFGFLAIDALLDTFNVSEAKANFSGVTARFSIDGEPCLSLKPEVYMNRSGTSVQQAMAFHKVALDHVLVLHDELDLPLGEIRIKQGGGSGGHNGLKDITRLVGNDYVRIRLGIGRPTIKGNEAEFVLHPFTNSDIIVVDKILPKAVLAVTTIVKNGLERAQRECQYREKTP
jgi:PTH1 family peptidyl-tRNA hydrolase